jgi:hypothetical protein
MRLGRPTVPQLNLYVSRELKDRMDAAGDTINWSETARSAFLQALTIHEQQENPNMEAAIARLKASKQATERWDKAKAKAQGRLWAETKAEYRMLAYIQNEVATTDPDEEEVNYENILLGALSDYQSATAPRDEEGCVQYSPVGDRATVYEQLLGDRNFDPVEKEECLGAFIDGALEFFREVKEQI